MSNISRKHADSDGKYRRPNSAARRVLRRRLHDHQGGLCYWCAREAGHGELDRVWPGKFGGTYRLDNLVLSCTDCNKARGISDARVVNKRQAKALLRAEIRLLTRRVVA